MPTSTSTTTNSNNNNNDTDTSNVVVVVVHDSANWKNNATLPVSVAEPHTASSVEK